MSVHESHQDASNATELDSRIGSSVGEGADAKTSAVGEGALSPDMFAAVYDTPLWDATLPVEDRVDWLLSEMTIEEKLGFLATTTPDLPRLGIARCYIGSEAAHGVEARHDQGDHPSAPDVTTSLPQPIGMAATWDADLLERAGEAVGIEARALWHRHPEGGLFRWAPTVDLERDPRWGRNEEGYGEDPVLTGCVTGAYVRGMQGGGPDQTRDHLRISAALKHFFANNVEDGRCVTNSTVDARNRREYYYEPFRRCIEHAGATSVMTSYNAVNGTVQMFDPRAEDLLHGEYGLYGHVVSDGGAVSLVHDARHDTDSHAETVARSLKAGVDCMTDDMNMVHTAVCTAWERGMIDEHDVDRALRRSFTTKVRLGLYDRPSCNPYDAVSDADIDSPEHRAIALRVAEESVVLLKNDGLLPLVPRETTVSCETTMSCETSDESVHGGIAVIGPLADQWFQDWYGGEPPYRSTVADGVRQTMMRLDGGEYGESAECNDFGAGGDSHPVAVDDGLDVVLLRVAGRYATLSDDGELRATDDRERAERFRFQDWGDGSLTFRAQSTGLYLTAEDDGTLRASKRMPFGWFVREVFHIADDGRLTTWSGVPVWLVNGDRIRAAQETDLSEQRIGVPQTIAVGGREAETLGESARIPAVEAFAMETVEHGLDRAAALAHDCGTVIAAVGCCSVINGKEDSDRPSTAFPPAQRVLMQTLLQANQRTVMVLISNYPYDIDWEQYHVPAIVWSASGGQSMGEAIARVVFGVTAPAGRLPQTWYGERTLLPDKNDYDVIATKRTYQWHDGDVLYPFGHGLTYAPFAYDDLRVTATCDAVVEGDGSLVADPCANVTASTVANVGASGNRSQGNGLPTQTQSSSDRRGTVFRASVRITNTGTTTSDEVVQWYIRHPSENGSAIALPHRRLAAFRRERAIAPGESRTVECAITREELRIFDVHKGDFRVPDGDYTVEAGASSADIRVSAIVRIHGERQVARPRKRWIPVDYWDAATNADLVAASPLPGQSAGEACAMVAHGSAEARRARGEDCSLSGVSADVSAGAPGTVPAGVPIGVSAGEPGTAPAGVSADVPGTVPSGTPAEICGTMPAASTDGLEPAAPPSASARFAGFEPFEPEATLHLAGTSIGRVRVRAAGEIIVPADDGTFPLPSGADELTLYVPAGAAVCGLRID